MDKLKILVVDDESRMRKLVRDFLEREGYAVLEAGDGMEALDIFYDIAKMIEDAVVTVYKDNKPVTNNEKLDEYGDDHKRIVRRGRFKFSMVGIKIGESITFIPSNTEVKVASDDSIEYEGRIYKLSPFVGTFMPEDKRNTSGAYQGAKYFSYKGKVLDDLRSAMENEETELERNEIDNIE